MPQMYTFIYKQVIDGKSTVIYVIAESKESADAGIERERLINVQFLTAQPATFPFVFVSP